MNSKFKGKRIRSKADRLVAKAYESLGAPVSEKLSFMEDQIYDIGKLTLAIRKPDIDPQLRSIFIESLVIMEAQLPQIIEGLKTEKGKEQEHNPIDATVWVGDKKYHLTEWNDTSIFGFAKFHKATALLITYPWFWCGRFFYKNERGKWEELKTSFLSRTDEFDL